MWRTKEIISSKSSVGQNEPSFASQRGSAEVTKLALSPDLNDVTLVPQVNGAVFSTLNDVDTVMPLGGSRHRTMSQWTESDLKDFCSECDYDLFYQVLQVDPRTYYGRDTHTCGLIVGTATQSSATKEESTDVGIAAKVRDTVNPQSLECNGEVRSLASLAAEAANLLITSVDSGRNGGDKTPLNEQKARSTSNGENALDNVETEDDRPHSADDASLSVEAHDVNATPQCMEEGISSQVLEEVSQAMDTLLKGHTKAWEAVMNNSDVQREEYTDPYSYKPVAWDTEDCEYLVQSMDKIVGEDTSTRSQSSCGAFQFKRYGSVEALSHVLSTDHLSQSNDLNAINNALTWLVSLSLVPETRELVERICPGVPLQHVGQEMYCSIVSNVFEGSGRFFQYEEDVVNKCPWMQGTKHSWMAPIDSLKYVTRADSLIAGLAAIYAVILDDRRGTEALDAKRIAGVYAYECMMLILKNSLHLRIETISRGLTLSEATLIYDNMARCVDKDATALRRHLTPVHCSLFESCIKKLSKYVHPTSW